nr:immunoglobulin light chain junction region [Macaca mulatta]MOV77815.1 immunoglobulin light chain junction region [Macaca mulatta]MOV77955.1 immunoglobulin light chain junction region [Macaca mulatta]MOV78066.1 immunoglobulin light chain junction region [Macaca mulatta]MOV78134.1 immunoglobulin light chain junction region [Macaca mulatta]
CQQDFGWPPTF